MEVRKKAKKAAVKKTGSKNVTAKEAGKKITAKSTGGKKVAAKSSNRRKPSGNNGIQGIRKQYLKSGDMCNVTFMLPKAAAPDARVINIVGDFNNWSLTETPMKKFKDCYKVTLKLPRGKEYKFRYLIDATRWENDWCADGYVPNPFGCDDSIVRV